MEVESKSKKQPSVRSVISRKEPTIDEDNKIKMDKQYTKEIVISIAATVLMLVCGYLSELIPKHKWQYFIYDFWQT